MNCGEHVSSIISPSRYEAEGDVSEEVVARLGTRCYLAAAVARHCYLGHQLVSRNVSEIDCVPLRLPTHARPSLAVEAQMTKQIVHRKRTVAIKTFFLSVILAYFFSVRLLPNGNDVIAPHSAFG